MREIAVRIALILAFVSAHAYADAPGDIPKAEPSSAPIPSPASPSADQSKETQAIISPSEVARAEPPKYRGVALDLTVGDGSGLGAIGHQYHNELAFYIEPKWGIGQAFARLRDTRFKTLSLSGYWALTQAVSGTDPSSFGSTANAGPEVPCDQNLVPSTNGGVIDPSQVGYCNPKANNRRLDQGDIRLTLKNPGIYTIPVVNVDVNPSLRFILPTSAESQYQTLRTAVTPSVSFTRGFWKDRIHGAGGVGFTKNFHQYTTPGVSVDQTGAATAQGGNPADPLNGVGLSNFFSDPSRVGTAGGYNVNYSWSGSADVSYDINDKWSVDVLYLYLTAVPYGHSCLTTVNGAPYDTCAAGNQVAANSGSNVDRPGHHDTEVFWATVSYKWKDWLAFNLAWINWAPAAFPDSSPRQPFISWNYDGFTTVQLSTTVSIDKLAAKKF